MRLPSHRVIVAGALAAACAVGNALAPSGGTAAVVGVVAGFGVEAVCENITGAPNKPRATAVMAIPRVAIDRAEVEVICRFIGRLPPPPTAAGACSRRAHARGSALAAAASGAAVSGG